MINMSRNSILSVAAALVAITGTAAAVCWNQAGYPCSDLPLKDRCPHTLYLIPYSCTANNGIYQNTGFASAGFFGTTQNQQNCAQSCTATCSMGYTHTINGTSIEYGSVGVGAGCTTGGTGTGGGGGNPTQ